MTDTKIQNGAVAVCLLVLSALQFGCAGDRQYAYDDIRSAYASVVCSISPVETGTADADSCAPNQPVSLTDAIGIALANNPDTKMALYRLRQADAMIAMADAKFYPALSFYTEYLQGDAPSAYLFKTLDQRRFPQNVDFNDPGWFQNYESGLQARMNLYNGGRDLLDKHMAENVRDIHQLDRLGVDNGLIAAVITAYCDALASREFITIARESVATVENQLRIMQVRFDGGSVLKSDVLSLVVRLAQAREEVILHENRLKTALAVLSNLLGISPEMGIRLRDDDLQAPVLPPAYPAGLVYAMDHRPEVQKARQQVVKSKMALDRAKTGYLPKLDLVTQYYMDDPSMAYDTDRENWTVAVLLNWDVFTGFSTKADAMRAEAILEEMLAADRKTVLAVKTDVKTAYLNLGAAGARLAVAEKSVASADETLNLVKQQYEGGSATVTRYLEAELSRNRSKTHTTAARYDRKKALADLGRAVGYWTRTTPTHPDEKLP